MFLSFMKEMDTFLDKRQNKSTDSSNDIFVILIISLTLIFLVIGSFLYFYDSPNPEDIGGFTFDDSPTKKGD